MSNHKSKHRRGAEKRITEIMTRIEKLLEKTRRIDVVPKKRKFAG